MNRIYISLILCIIFLLSAKSQTVDSEIPVRFELEEVVVLSTKEFSDLKTSPASVSFITSRMIDEWQITSIVDLSSIIPNFFVPNYGSKMSSPVYIRGIGERSTGQSTALYIDNMPCLSKSVFNFEFLDVQRIEALNGPQGTLYGRNAMSGIVNIYTWSPLDYERTKVSLTAGNYGFFRFNASVSKKITEKVGISLSGYNDGNKGFFINQYDGKSADYLRSAGGRFRLDFKPAKKWGIQWINNYDYSNQGAFPYGIYENGKISEPNYDNSGNYIREMFNSSINVQYKNEKIVFTSSSGLQYLDDDMNMDVDYSPMPYFTLNQKQKETNLTQEFILKSNISKNYQWLFGAFGFNRDLMTEVVTTMAKAGIDSILQPVLNEATANNPRAPSLIVTNSEIPMPGTFKTPAFGGAFFHQSSYNNLIFNGLSLTAGLRFDYEETKLDYNTYMLANINAVINGNVIGSQEAGTKLLGKGSMSFVEWLPKIALKYEFDKKHFIYFSTAKGYKTGGYNIQMFADIVQDVVAKKYQSGQPANPIPQESRDSILALTSYKPEYSWNYELGFKGEVIKNKLFTEVAVFYIDVKDVLITQFVQSGQGRMLKNAGRAESMGIEVKLRAYLFDGFTLLANYGFTRAILKEYETEAVNYSGNFIPFAPQNTFSLNAEYAYNLRNNRIIDRFNIHAQYNGTGKIYWTEDNDVFQNFYGLLNLKAGVMKGVFGFNVWTRNLLNTDYTAFYFETKTKKSEQKFAQKGTPFQIGVDLTMSF